MQVRILCLGDVVGKPGRQILADQLKQFVAERQIHGVIVNGENSAGGSGISGPIYDKLLAYGVDVITMGDHVFRKREGLGVIGEAKRIVRPANLAKEAAGKGYLVHTLACGVEVAVINLLGQVYMRQPPDCAFHAVQECLSKIDPAVKIRIVDMHAEATSEKVAMGWYLDGRVSIVFGTHTHVTTADERILPQGTAYSTDLGMTGAHESVLGRRTDQVLKMLTTSMPCRFELATGDVRINGILVEVDSLTGKADKIERICLHGKSDSNSGAAGGVGQEL
ncbi:MAG: TIGR00282 family metallophosphoesterase [Actinobacteria bacterium]|nr:TIGR00282 family metallophosphoesterase [Actinomycetota bacterium]